MKPRPWTDEEIDFLLENYSKMSNKEIAKKLNRSYKAITGQANKWGIKKEFGSEMFAVYRGDEVLGVGTRDELVAGLGVTKNRLFKLASPNYHKALKEGSNAMIAYRLDDMEEMA